jgi:hypothetical protein
VPSPLNCHEGANDLSTLLTSIVSAVLFLGGLALIVLAFEATAFMASLFFAGILAISLAIIIPLHLLPAVD